MFSILKYENIAYICIRIKNNNIKKLIIMENLKIKVESILIKNGNNANDVKDMIKTHFDQASKIYTSAKTIAEYIRTIY